MSTKNLSSDLKGSASVRGQARTSRFTLSMPLQLSDRLQELANQKGVTQSDILRRALALFDAAERAHQEGDQVIFRNPETNKEREVIGL